MSTRDTLSMAPQITLRTNASCDDFMKNITALQLAGIGIREVGKGKPLTKSVEYGPHYDEYSRTAYLSVDFFKARVYLCKEKGAPQQTEEWWMEKLRKALGVDATRGVAIASSKENIEVDEDDNMASPSIDDLEAPSDKPALDGYDFITNLQTIRDAHIDVNVDLKQAPVLLKSLPEAWLRIGSGYVPNGLLDEKSGKQVAWFHRAFLMALFRMNKQAVRNGTCMASDWQEHLCREMKLDVEELIMYKEMGFLE